MGGGGDPPAPPNGSGEGEVAQGIVCRRGSVAPCAPGRGWRIAVGQHPACPASPLPLSEVPARKVPGSPRPRPAGGGNKRPFLRAAAPGSWPAARGGADNPGACGQGGAARVAKVTRARGRLPRRGAGGGAAGRRRHHERPEAQLHLRGLRRVGAPGGGARVLAEAPGVGGPGAGGAALASLGLRVRGALRG